MLLLLVELGQFVQLVQLAVDPRTDEALRAQLLEHRQVLALALADHRGEQHQLAAFRQGQHLVDHLADRLRLQRHVVVRAARGADAGVEQAQVVVDLGDRAHGGARVVRGGLLLDGDRRRQPLDGVDVGLLHHRQELAGVGGQRFHVAALALGVQGVEGQRRLARAGQAGDHDQLVARQGQVDVLQVVGAGTPDHNLVHKQRPRMAGGKPASIRPLAATRQSVTAVPSLMGLLESPPISSRRFPCTIPTASA
ncbi:hypothetical protein D3C86_1381550 [compost metagenome]